MIKDDTEGGPSGPLIAPDNVPAPEMAISKAVADRVLSVYANNVGTFEDLVKLPCLFPRKFQFYSFREATQFP